MICGALQHQRATSLFVSKSTALIPAFHFISTQQENQTSEAQQLEEKVKTSDIIR